MSENKQFSDMSYAKKNKQLCIYCSYREAVPSKNKLFCCELCRLLHFSVNKDLINLEDISKLIKLNKVDLIEMILNLKCQDFTKEDLLKHFGKEDQIKTIQINKDKKKYVVF